MAKNLYRHYHNATLGLDWLVDHYGNRYLFKKDTAFPGWYFLDALPEVEVGSPLLCGQYVKEIIDNLNQSGLVEIKEWE